MGGLALPAPHSLPELDESLVLADKIMGMIKAASL